LDVILNIVGNIARNMLCYFLTQF